MNPCFHRISNAFIVLLLLSFSQALVAQSYLSEAKAARQAAGTVKDISILLLEAQWQRSQQLPVTPLVSAQELSSAPQPALFLHDDKGRVAIRFRALSPENLLPELLALGMVETGRNEQLGLLEGFFPYERLTDLEGLKQAGLLSASAIWQPTTEAGTVGSQADTTLSTYRVRNFGPSFLDGTGQKIGVLSDSYNNLNGAAAGIASGNLPNDVRNLQDLSSGGIDEGRAMIELIHDLAPGATKYFATAFTGELGFASNIQLLADSGCQVIVDDVVYFEEPFFQDGIIAQSVISVTEMDDAIYFSSAGNRANRAYEALGPGFGIDALSGSFSHDFNTGGGTDFYQAYTLNPLDRIRVTLQWDDPFYTFSGADTDLDLLLISDPVSGLGVLASSTGNNLLTQRPVETLSYTNLTGSVQTVSLRIDLAAGPAPGRLKMVHFGTYAPQEFATNSPTINPHAGSTACVAVAAAPFYQRQPESFTSMGPTTVLFSPTGASLGGAEVRNKPDFTATDGCNTSFFGGDTGADPDAFPNFFGTSAAAPHAAAVASLIRQAFPAEDRNAVYNRLIASAADISNSGFDFITGQGIIDAWRAIYPVVPASLPLTETLESGTLGQAWELSSNQLGRILFTGSQGPSQGSTHITMDTWFGLGINSLNEAVLHIDATGLSDLSLSFDQKEVNDDDHPMPATFSGSSNSDGVAMSVDGVNWVRLTSLTGSGSSSSYTNRVIDLSSVATANSLTLGSDVRIKFQQYDASPFPDDGITFDQFSVSGTPFPVEWLWLAGEWVNSTTAQIEWKTASEQNNHHFSVERSADGLFFEVIGEVPGNGNTQDPSLYRFWDLQPLSGTNFYRLRQVDFDGQYRLSELLRLERAAGTRSEVSPNPWKGDPLTLRLFDQEAGPVPVQVSDLQGRILWQQLLWTTTGDQVRVLALPNLPEGLYAVRVGNDIHRLWRQ